MKTVNKISTGVVFVGFFFLIATVHADSGQVNRQLIAQPIVGVVTAVDDNSLFVTAQSFSTAAITSSIVETGRTRILRSTTASSVSNVQVSEKILAISAISSSNIATKSILENTVCYIRGPPTGKVAV